MKQEILQQILAPVFNIQKFCTHDGNGVRTTVFFKGCNMRCSWCANPESQNNKPELLFYQNKCVGCKACLHTCPEHAISISEEKITQNHELCINCGACADACLFEARKLIGKYMSPEEVFTEINKDRIFYTLSGGGVTFSGGEPLLYSNFIQAVARKCHKEGYTVFAETCGCFPTTYIDKIVDSVDKLLFDLKIMDSEEHRKYCGVTNEKLLNNFKILSRYVDIQPRVPIIPGITDTDDNIEAICAFLKECETDFPFVHILPYHILGIGKYAALGKTYELPDIKQIEPGDPTLNRVKSIFEREGFQVKIGG